MKISKFLRINRFLHKWPAIIIALFAALFALSGIVLNHRGVFSSMDIPRKLMPPGYQYKNWNMAGVRGSLFVNRDSVFVFGNIGVWLTNQELSGFSDFNRGFPGGIDRRKIYSLVHFKGQLIAATHFGLFATGISAPDWHILNIPEKEDRLADLILKGDTLVVLTRHVALKSTDLKTFNTFQLPPPEGYKRETGLFNTLWEFHSGELWGTTGIFTVDLLGLTVIFMSVTGLLHFFIPGWIRKRKSRKKAVRPLTLTARKNLKWHNVAGYIFIFFLLLNTMAGMFLRPPLLIPIADSKVGIIPHTHIDQPNPWFDKLRRITWNDSLKVYLISTSDGFYLADESFTSPLSLLKSQPPVSIMGCNVLEQTGPTRYLTGSFSGLYLWNIHSGEITDCFSGDGTKQGTRTGRPISDHMVAGWIRLPGGKSWWLDYNRGAALFGGDAQFPPMTREILQKTPVSVWNAALEIHTGRIFEHLTGPFYILYVPLAGLCLILVLISGFIVWWKIFRKR